MIAATSTDSVPGDAKTDTVCIEFSLDSDKQYGVTGDFLTSPLVPAGSGYVCLKVFPHGSYTSEGKSVSAFVEYVPNVLWSAEWIMPKLRYSISVLNMVDEKDTIRKRDSHIFEVGQEDTGWHDLLLCASWEEFGRNGWLSPEGAMMFTASITGNFSSEQCLVKDLSAVAKMWSTGKLADMAVLAESGESFPCHRCVMVNASPVFEQMLMNNWQEAKDAQITIRHEAAVVVQIFVGYVYTSLLPEHADYGALLRLGDMYEIPGLSKLCLSKMTEAVNPITVGATLQTFAQHKRCAGADSVCKKIAKKAKTDANFAVAIARHIMTNKMGSAMQKKLLQNLLTDKQAVSKAVQPVLDDDLLAD